MWTEETLYKAFQHHEQLKKEKQQEQEQLQDAISKDPITNDSILYIIAKLIFTFVMFFCRPTGWASYTALINKNRGGVGTYYEVHKRNINKSRIQWVLCNYPHTILFLIYVFTMLSLY